MVEDITTDKQCLSCVALKQEVEVVKKDKASTLKAIKEKIISTDKLIRKFNKKCDDFNKQAKQLDELNKIHGECKRNEADLQEQLKEALGKIEPQKKNITRLLQEKFTAEEKILTLKTENENLQGIISSLESTLQLKDDIELSWKKEQQSHEKKLQKERQREEKLRDDLRKAAQQRQKDKGLLRKKAQELKSVNHKRQKLEAQVNKLKEQVRVLRIQCKTKDKKKANVSTDAAALKLPPSELEPMFPDSPDDIPTAQNATQKDSLPNIFNEMDGLNTPVLSPLSGSQDTDSCSSSDTDNSDDSSSSDNELSDLGNCLEVELGDMNSAAANTASESLCKDSCGEDSCQGQPNNQQTPCQILVDLNLSEDDDSQSDSEMTDRKLNSPNYPLLQMDEVDVIMGEDNDNPLVGSIFGEDVCQSTSINLALEKSETSSNDFHSSGKPPNTVMVGNTEHITQDNKAFDVDDSHCDDDDDVKTDTRRASEGLEDKPTDEGIQSCDNDKGDEGSYVSSPQTHNVSDHNDNTILSRSGQEMVKSKDSMEDTSKNSNSSGNQNNVNSKSCNKIPGLETEISISTKEDNTTTNSPQKACDEEENHEADNEGKPYTKIKTECQNIYSKEANVNKPEQYASRKDHPTDEKSILGSEKEYSEGFSSQNICSNQKLRDGVSTDKSVVPCEVKPNNVKESLEQLQGNDIELKDETGGESNAPNSLEQLQANDNELKHETDRESNTPNSLAQLQANDNELKHETGRESNAPTKEENSTIFTKIISYTNTLADNSYDDNNVDNGRDDGDEITINELKSFPCHAKSSSEVQPNVDKRQDCLNQETNTKHPILDSGLNLLVTENQSSEPKELTSEIYKLNSYTKKRIAHRPKLKRNEVTPPIEKNAQVCKDKEAIGNVRDRNSFCANQIDTITKLDGNSDKAISRLSRKIFGPRTSQEKRKCVETSLVNSNKRKKVEQISSKVDQRSCSSLEAIKTCEDLENNNQVPKTNEIATISSKQVNEETQNLTPDSEVGVNSEVMDQSSVPIEQYQKLAIDTNYERNKDLEADKLSDSSTTNKQSEGINDCKISVTETCNSPRFCVVGESSNVVSKFGKEVSFTSKTDSSSPTNPHDHYSESETTVMESNLSQIIFHGDETEPGISESVIESLINDVLETDIVQVVCEDGTIDREMQVHMDSSDEVFTSSIATISTTQDHQSNPCVITEDTNSKSEFLCKTDISSPDISDVLKDYKGVFSGLVPTLPPIPPSPPPPQNPTPPTEDAKPESLRKGFFTPPSLFSWSNTSSKVNRAAAGGSGGQEKTKPSQAKTPPTKSDRPDSSIKGLFTSPSLLSSPNTSSKHITEPPTPSQTKTPPTKSDRPDSSIKCLFTSPSLFSSPNTSSKHITEPPTGSQTKRKKSRKKSKKNSAGFSVRPVFLSELQYSTKALRYLQRDDIKVDDIVERLSDKRNLSGETPLASALMVFRYQEEFMQTIMKFFTDRNRHDAVSSRQDAPSLLSRFEERVLEMIRKLTSEEHLKKLSELVITYLSKAIVYTYLKAGNEEPDKRITASHCRIMCSLCRDNGNLSRMRVLCFDVIRILSSRPGTILYLMTSIAAVWPAVLSYPSTSWEISGGSFRLRRPGFEPLVCTIHMMMAYLVSSYDWVMLGRIIDWLCSWKHVNPGLVILEQLCEELVRLMKDPSFAELMIDKDGHPVLGYGLYEVVKSIELLTCILGWVWLNNVLIRRVIWDILSSWANQSQPSTSTTHTICNEDDCCNLVTTDGKNQKEQHPRTFICEATVVATIRLLGLVCRLAIEHNQNEIPQLFPVLLGILNGTQQEQVTLAIHLATAYTLLEVSPWQPREVLSALKTWKASQPDDLPLPSSLEQGLVALESSLSQDEKQFQAKP